METNLDPQVDINDESEIDKILEESFATVRAEKPLVENPQEIVESEESDKETSTGTTEKPSSSLLEKDTNSDDPTQEIAESFKTPVKGKFESEESYQKRIDLAELVKQRKLARTEEEQKRLSGEISNVRRELATIHQSDKNNYPPNPGEKQEDLSTKEAITREDLVRELERVEFERNVKSTLETFLQRHKELQDEDTREVFFDFVDSNYNWNNKSGQQLMTVLELARENMFKPSQTIQERVLKAANVQEKVNAMQFPGGSIVRPGLTSEQQQSINELKATGMSEEKAMALILE